MTYQLIEGNCLAELKKLPDASIDSVISDPPYPCVKRPYGTMNVADWESLIHGVVKECRRLLKPTGSILFILQPNSEHVGKLRPWLWDFQSWAAKEWGIVQDLYWWNYTSPPTVHCHRDIGLCRPSVKPLVWIGDADCYRCQDKVLWTTSDACKAVDKSNMALQYTPCGLSNRKGRCAQTAQDRGGSTPFNLIPISNATSNGPTSPHGHPAATPYALCDWLCKYLCPEGGTVCDPFSGSGTVGLAAIKQGKAYVGIEARADYVEVARKRLEAATASPQTTATQPTDPSLPKPQEAAYDGEGMYK